MAHLTLEVPEDLQSKLRARAAESGYADLQSYLQALLQSEADVVAAPDEDYGAPADVNVTSRAQLEGKLLEGLNSGPATEMTDAEWDAVRREVADRIAARHNSRSKPE